MFHGIYRGKKGHDDDFELVLQRAVDAGLDKMMITSGCLQDIKDSLDIIKSNTSGRLFTTFGVHPTRCGEFEASGDPEAHLQELLNVYRANKDTIVAVGECGLDYDRLEFCPKETQKQFFEMQFRLAEESSLPMFLHNRATEGDFADMIRRNRDRFSAGVSHSFTGSVAEMQELVDLNIYIGINGCSLKTAENLEVVKAIPLEKLMLETDAPWCDIRSTHAGFSFIKTLFPDKKKERFERGMLVKGRNEPCTIRQVAEVVAGVREEDIETVCEQVYENTLNVFFNS
eukprot:GILI01024227.1.p1 GENE.GILI01024227.1~~GILI01024227.1.p1  ORF type:complete len:309 (+),score=22.57 GILI01024227.1:72-929(+)